MTNNKIVKLTESVLVLGKKFQETIAHLINTTIN